MKIFNKFKKQNQEDIIDDVSYIKEIKHISAEPWHQYDILLNASPYGWSYMIELAEYMNSADVENVSTITVSNMNTPEIELIDFYKANGKKINSIPNITNEKGFLSIGGISRVLKAPTKIVWVNQTRVIRIFTLVDNEELIRRYTETIIRRTFGTKDEMKLAKLAE